MSDANDRMEAGTITITGLRNGTTYTVAVRAVNAVGAGPRSRTATVVPATVPGAPLLATAKSGKAGGAVTAKALWIAPRSNGGLRITGYKVTIKQVGVAGTISQIVRPSARSLKVTGLVKGASYRFAVTAINPVGKSHRSAWSLSAIAR